MAFIRVGALSLTAFITIFTLSEASEAMITTTSNGHSDEEATSLGLSYSGLTYLYCQIFSLLFTCSLLPFADSLLLVFHQH